MNNKINDLYETLDKNINLSKTFILKKISIKNKFKFGLNDINQNLNNIDISCKKNIGIHQNKTKNFDSFLISRKLKNLDISNKPSLYKKILLGLKGKITLSGKLIGTFNNRIYFTKNFLKNTVSIVIIIFILLGIDAYIIKYNIKSGYEKIISIKDHSGDIDYIQNTINKSKLNFVIGSILFKPFLIIPSDNIKNGYYLLEGGKNLTKFIDNGIQTYLSINKLIINKGGLENIKITNLLSNLKPELNILNNLLYNVIVSYNNITDLGNDNLNLKLDGVKSKLLKSYSILNILNKDYDSLLGLFGHKKEKKYLILFQNNDEIRATGGFIGSLATIIIKDGKIIDFSKDDVYAYEWEINKIYKTKSVAPEGLNKITKTFGLRDSNYFIDFESSSKSINFFLKKIGKDVDGIIYINQNTFLDFLKLIGPIEFNTVGEKITEENFSLMISTLVEAQSFKVGTLGTPKKVLFDFANLFLDKLKSEKDYFAYLDIIIKNFKTRDLVIYSFNPEENNLLWKLGLNGKINYSNTLDFNYPVYTSIGGNKSDRYIEIKYQKNIIYNYDCSIDTNLSIYRTHFFSKFEEKKVNQLLDIHPIKDKTRKDIINIQGKGANKVYVRVVLPKNINVKPKKGMNIFKYENTTVVDFYMTTRLLESVNYNIEYTIENKACKKYNYYLYKQPGIRKYKIQINNNSNNFINGDFYYEKQD